MKINNDKNEFYRYCAILVLSIIFSVLILIFSIPKAHALERRYSDYQIGNQLYGFNVPQRDATDNSTTKNYVNIGFGSFDHGTNYLSPINYGKAWLHLNNLPEAVLNLDPTLENSSQIWTTGISNYQYTPVYYADYRYQRIWWGFHPGDSTNDPTDMFENNHSFYYSRDYSYSFDVILYMTDGDLCDSNDNNNNNLCLNTDQIIGTCFTYDVNGTPFNSCSGSVGNNLQIEVVRSNLNGSDGTGKHNYIHYKVTVPYNYLYGFNESANWAQWQYNDNFYNVTYGFYINSIINYRPAVSGLNVNEYLNIFVSQPYDIVYWTTDNYIECQDRCVTDKDAKITDNIDSSDKFTNSFINEIGSLINRDYGFAGIVNLTYNFVYNTLTSTGTTCPNFTIPVLSASISLPNGCSFWNRSDIESFKDTYEMIFMGVISFFIAWKVYKDILRIISLNTSLTSGTGVDDL